MIFSKFKNCYKTTISTIVQSWPKNRHIDQWSRIESPNIGAHKCNKLIFDKETKVIFMKNKYSFQ